MLSVTVYSLPGCNLCEVVKTFLKDNGILFNELVFGKDFTSEWFKEEFGEGKSFPQLKVNDVNIGGMRETIEYFVVNQLVE